MIMLLKYIQEGLSLGFKVHDTVLRFQISRLSMHVPDGVFDWHDGHPGLLFWGWGMGYSCVCECECVCWEVGMGGGGVGGEGLPLCLPPLEIQKAVCLALRLRHRGQIWCGVGHTGAGGELCSEGRDSFFFSDLWEETDTHFFFLFVRLLTSPNWLYHSQLFPV